VSKDCSPVQVPSNPPPANGPADSIEQFWDNWRAKRKTSGVTMESVAAHSGIGKSTLYDLGKPGKNGFIEERSVMKLLELIKLPQDERAVQLARYQRLETASKVSEPDPEPDRRPSWRRLWLTAIVTGLVAAIGGAVITMLVRQPIEASTSTPYAAIRVQNMVALGENDLRPDETLAYLSSKRERRCAARGCDVSGTEMDTGKLLVATCQADGEELANFNIDSTSPDNPHRARSSRWYFVQLTDGKTGFINEVYIDPHDRGGLGLATCR
jgi:hypothetical protein